MKNKKRSWFCGIAILTICYLCSGLFSCKSSSSRNDSDIPQSNENKIEKDFRREGFISHSIFRVVIVKPSESSNDDIAEIISIGKKRALMTLKHYLIAQDRIMTPNVNAKLLNLVNNYGGIRCIKKNDCKTRKVFYYEIEKDNIRNYVERTASHR